MSWLKITKSGLFLMKSSSDKYVAKVNGTPRAADGTEIGIALPLDWFSGRDVPSTLIVDLNSPDPSPVLTHSSSRGSGLSGKRIVLDPGHGEVKGGVNDPGAVNRRLNINERDLVRKQADIISAFLQGQGASVEIVANNTNMSLREIGARGAGSDCFVSLHLNAFNNSAQGHEVLIDTNESTADKELAEAINAELESALSITNRGVKRQGLGVLRGVPLPVPAVLVESFFIDAVPDANSMENLVATSANAIAKGISRFLDTLA
jgi:N-acetylmuramoyl-L-alanine amidase